MSAENAAEVNGGAEVSIKSKILDNPSFKELSQEEIDQEIVSNIIRNTACAVKHSNHLHR
jgi:hypothetical protein